jgi:hypothetical protein
MINGSFPISNQQAEHSKYKKLTNDTGNLEAPPSFEIDWATRIGLLRPLLVEALSHPTIQRSRTFRIVQPLELPARLYDVLIIFDNTIGQRAVEIFMTLTRELSGEIHRQPESWTKTELAQMNENLRQAMGCLARLCIHPAADYCSFGRFDGYLELGVDTPAAATMTLRERPELSWVAQVDPHDGQPELSDPHIYEMLESGESESARNEMVRGLAANLSPTGLAPDRVDDKLIKRLRARAISEAAEGRSRYIVGSQVSVETSKWVWSQLKVGVVKPTGDDGSIYLYEEAVLMMRLHQFLEYFKQSEW